MLGYSSPEELLRMRASDLYGREADRKAFLKRLLEAGSLLSVPLLPELETWRPSSDW